MNPSEESESRGMLGSGSRSRRMRTMRGSGAQTVRDLRNNMGKFCLLNHLPGAGTVSHGRTHLAQPAKNPCVAIVRRFGGV
ncbi:Hypp4380 [Branchiostoma lanceolatum]|uniref:Hypp4380 protein n=1 Tax=Branchiostoma lanceolatum TaxID=7740 RepID=A0A8K0A9P6_BRALA|nr:Hypp4380 [Branchiostoma lanceolatum]